MNKLIHICISLCFIFITYTSFSQVNIATGGNVTQNFDAIGTTASSTLPSGWKASNPATAQTVSAYSSAGTTTTQIGGNSLSSSAGNGIYNFGAGVASSATDRAVGGLSSGSASKSVNIYTDLLNNGTSTITSFEISYNVEKYRNGTNASGFSIQMYTSPDGITWTKATNFLTNFSANADNNGFSTAPGSTTNVNDTLTINVAANEHLFLAWNYSVTTGSTTSNAQAIGIDDVSIIAHGSASIIPTKLLMSGIPVGAEVGIPFNLTVCATDNSNSIAADYITAITLSQTVGTSATVTPSSTETPTNGCVTFTITPTVGGENINFTATSGTLTSASSGNIAVAEPYVTCYADVNCDYSIKPVILNSQSDNWICNAGTYSVNGFVSTTETSPSELWLVSPTYLWNAVNGKFTANLDESFDGSTIQISYSTNYAGDPALATWTTLGSFTADGSISLDIVGITAGSHVNIGIKYTATGTTGGSSSYVLSNLELKSTECGQISITSCLIEDVVVSNISTCNNNSTPTVPLDDTFTADLSVEYINPPSTGNLVVTRNAGTVTVASVAVSTLTTSPHIFSGLSFPANGSVVDYEVKFSDLTECSFIGQLAAVQNCSNEPSAIEIIPEINPSAFVGEGFEINICFTDGAGNNVTSPNYPEILFDEIPEVILDSISGTGPCFTYHFQAAVIGSPLTLSFHDIDYIFSLYQPFEVLAQPCSDILISELSDPDTVSAIKFVEIFNAGSIAHDISGFKLRVFSNGSTTASSTFTIPASTTLNPQEVFVIRGNGSAYNNFTACASTHIMISGSMTINGDDAVELVDVTNNRLDIFGVIGVAPIANTAWNYLDKVVQRNPSQLCGRRNFELNEWHISSTKSAPAYSSPCSNCLLPSVGASAGQGEITATHEWTNPNSGWTDYYDCVSKKLVLSVKKNSNNIGRKGDANFSVKNFANSGATYLPSSTSNYVGNQNGFVVMNRYWNLIPTTQPTSNVNVKFYFDNTDIEAVNTLAQLNEIEPITATTAFTYKINGNFDFNPANGHTGIPLATAYDADGYWQFKPDTASTNSWALSGNFPNYAAEYQIKKFSGGGAGAGDQVNGALPIQIQSFIGNEVKQGFKLNWVLFADASSYSIELQKSVDGINYTTIYVNPALLHGKIIDQFIDLNIKNLKNYYRLLVTSREGIKKFSNVILYKKSTIDNINIYPTLFTDGINISSNQQGSELSKIEILDVKGKVILKFDEMYIQNEPNFINLSNLEQGIYFIRFNNNEQYNVKKLVKI